MSAPPTPKKKAVGMSMKPADGVMRTNPAIAPMNVESRDHFPLSQYVRHAHVSAPAEAHRLVTHIAMTDLKFSERVVPASKASQDPQMMIIASNWDIVLCGLCNLRCPGLRFSDFFDRAMGYDKYRLSAVAVAPLHI